jgi:hypothetical protein
MWERFMTQPLVDKGIFRRIADCPTPWPCFVVAVREEILNQPPEIIAKILEVINSNTLNFKLLPNIIEKLAVRFHQKEEDLEKWLALTEWSQNQLSENVLNNVQNQLLELGIIDKKSTFAEIVKVV